jgi:enoyl-CoA hydratase/carnithine racemase
MATVFSEESTPATASEFGPVFMELTDGVATVVVDSPPVNAMGTTVLAGLEAAAARLEGDPDVRVVVLTGNGTKAFMAGADISEFEQLRARENGMAEHSAWAGSVLAAWANLPQPVIAAVQASAVGGGLEIALVADLIIADPTAKFGLPEVKLGLIPGGGGTQRLPRRIGTSRAKELMFLGAVIDAEHAHRIGLVNHVAEKGAALRHGQEIARKIAAMPRRAVQALKDATTENLDGAVERERSLFLGVADSPDFREGFSAFMEKRAPRFTHQ